MREIKFRAFRKEDGEMLDMKDDSWVFCFHKDGNYIISNQREPDYCFSQENIILMQFTGLTDRNGIEIYEGDILFSPTLSFDDEPFIVKFGCYDNGKSYDDLIKGNGFYVEILGIPEVCYSSLYALSDMNEWNLIGNIHQNPYLLWKDK